MSELEFHKVYAVSPYFDCCNLGFLINVIHTITMKHNHTEPGHVVQLTVRGTELNTQSSTYSHGN